ncbi:hypothetical protein [Bradyrhizobium sp. STM 3562]|uniref:hypothetical protein n=1 Tax=Bradyrhizobium sp. STM 3562 TaxID=578924 RepID=UPI0038906A4A
MEPAAADADPPILRDAKDIDIAMTEADGVMLARLSRVDGLRRNTSSRDTITGSDASVALRSSALTRKADSSCRARDERPAQGKRRALIAQERQLLEAPKRLALGGDDVLKHLSPRGGIADGVVTFVAKRIDQDRHALMIRNHRTSGEQQPRARRGEAGDDQAGDGRHREDAGKELDGGDECPALLYVRCGRSPLFAYLSQAAGPS